MSFSVTRSLLKPRIAPGYWSETNFNYLRAKPYMHHVQLKKYFAFIELYRTRLWMAKLQGEKTGMYNAGLAPSGHGAFERELERKGIAVDKYPLPSTTGVKRVHEMVVLRRMELERKAEAAMAQARQSKQVATPSAWYDESNGPLNPAYLRAVAAQYSGMDVTALPHVPYQHGGHS